jgi:Ataxin-2 C-terminal region
MAVVENNSMAGMRSGEGVVEEREEGLKREIRDLQELLSKLNPMAEEFVPPSLSSGVYGGGIAGGAVDGGQALGFYQNGLFVENVAALGFGVGGGARRVSISISL